MPKISVSGPADLLTILPFHLGFQPTRSVVVVCFHGKRLGLVARFDLPPDDLVQAVATDGLRTLVRDRPSSAWVVGFEREAGGSDVLAEALRDGLERERVIVHERLVVRDGRWFAVDCACCPQDGTPLPDAADVPAVAGYVALGHTVLDDRAAAAALVAPLLDTDPRHDQSEQAIDRWQARYTVAVALARLRDRGVLRGGDRGVLRGGDRGVLRGDSIDVDVEVDDDVDAGDRRDGREAAGDDGTSDGRQGSDASEGSGGSEGGERSTASDEAWAVHGGEEREVGVGGDSATVIDLEAPTRPRTDGRRPRRPPGGHAARVAVDPPPALLMQAEAAAAWGAVLHGELSPEELDARIPALVAPLRDTAFRDALMAWLCPGSLPLEAFPPELVALMEQHLGAGIRPAGQAGASPTHAGRPAEGRPPSRRSGPRRGRRQRLARPRVGPPGDASWQGESGARASASWEEWREWEEASSAHRLHARLEFVCRATPAAHAAPLLAVVANYAWWRGDGARAGMAVDTALDLEPDYRLARLIRQALDLGARGDGAWSGLDPQRSSPPRASGSWNGPSSA